MTVGDLIDAIERIKELEKKRQIIINSYDDYMDADRKIKEIDTLIGIYRSESLDGEDSDD